MGLRDEIEAGRDPIPIHPGGARVERGDQRGPQLQMGGAAGHGNLTPFTLSWIRVSPIHSFRVGTNATSQTPDACCCR